MHMSRTSRAAASSNLDHDAALIAWLAGTYDAASQSLAAESSLLPDEDLSTSVAGRSPAVFDEVFSGLEVAGQ
jgi:hypothetical protein